MCNRRATDAQVSVTLSPGDALYVPAFVFHHVTALSPSVSLNVFSDSPVKLAASATFALPPPIGREWPLELRRRAVRLIIDPQLEPTADRRVTAARPRCGRRV